MAFVMTFMRFKKCKLVTIEYNNRFFINCHHYCLCQKTI